MNIASTFLKQEVDGTGSLSCRMEGFGISGDEF
jgi:hypothetical protein